MNPSDFDSALPDKCPTCGAECEQYEHAAPDLERYEGAQYGCGLDLYVIDGLIEVENVCERATHLWVNTRNEAIRATSKSTT